MKIVNSQNIEFGYELIAVLPYAYYLHKKHKLKKTISGKDSKAIYYFSKNHEINEENRSWYNTKKCHDIPNIKIHKEYLNFDEWIPPDFVKRYSNKEYVYKKEIVCICNRYNIEWGAEPINYFDLPTLKRLFDLLKDKYQIIYFNIDGQKDLYDNANPIPLGDYEMIKKEYNNDVLIIHDIYKTNESFNETQLKIFANCNKFITLNGGYSILASYFKGENIVYCRSHPKSLLKETMDGINSFYRWYHKFNKQRITHVDTIDNLLNTVKLQFVEDSPLINILIRTSKRPIFFKNCIESIYSQTYKNYRIIISYDNEETSNYVINYKFSQIKVEKNKEIIPPPDKSENFGIYFPYNLYFNELHEYVNKGYIMYLDDDDILSHSGVLENISKEIKNKKSDLIFWRVKNENRIIPCDKNFNKAPVLKDISGIGFIYNSIYKNLANWEAFKRGDYRIAKKLYENINNKSFINEILTEVQFCEGAGLALDKLDYENKFITVKIINNKFKGAKMDFNINEIYSLPYKQALQFIKLGLAEKL